MSTSTVLLTELALDGHNYPAWSSDMKISLTCRNLYQVITEPEAGDPTITSSQRSGVLLLLRNYIHPDLKAQYLMEENPQALWNALKARYEKQKELIYPEASYEWNNLRIQDFKSVEEYNRAVHNICSKLKFCDKEPKDPEKIEKTLSTMLPADRVLQHQFRAMKFEHYSELIHILTQAEKHDELLLKNHHKLPTGAKPLPEVHNNVQNSNSDKFNGQFRPFTKNFKGNKNFKRNNKYKAYNKGKGNSKPRFDKSKTCNKCGCFKHTTKKCRTPKHLVDLYLKSQGRGRKSQGSRYEAHFSHQPTFNKETSSSKQVLPQQGTSKNETSDQLGKSSDTTNNMIIEFASNDMFGDMD